MILLKIKCRLKLKINKLRSNCLIYAWTNNFANLCSFLLSVKWKKFSWKIKKYEQIKPFPNSFSLCIDIVYWSVWVWNFFISSIICLIYLKFGKIVWLEHLVYIDLSYFSYYMCRNNSLCRFNFHRFVFIKYLYSFVRIKLSLSGYFNQMGEQLLFKFRCTKNPGFSFFHDFFYI